VYHQLGAGPRQAPVSARAARGCDRHDPAAPHGFLQHGLGPGGCGAVDDLVIYDARLTCYEPDPSYTVTFSKPFQSDSTQGVLVGAYAPRPASPLIATQALLIPCLTGACP